MPLSRLIPLSKDDWDVVFSFVKYCTVGLVNTSVSVSIMAGLAYVGVHYALYTLIGYVVAMVVSYLLNARYTFQSGRIHWRQFGRFMGFSCLLLLLTEIIQFLLIEKLAVRELYGVASGVVCYTGMGFLLSKRYVFIPTNTEHVTDSVSN